MVRGIIACKVRLLEFSWSSLGYRPLTEAACVVDMRLHFVRTPAPRAPICDMGTWRVLACARDVLIQIFAGALPVALAVILVRAENEKYAQPAKHDLIFEFGQLIDRVDGHAIDRAQPIGQILKAIKTERFVTAWQDTRVHHRHGAYVANRLLDQVTRGIG
jgi:hypothetical protein